MRKDSPSTCHAFNRHVKLRSPAFFFFGFSCLFLTKLSPLTISILPFHSIFAIIPLPLLDFTPWGHVNIPRARFPADCPIGSLIIRVFDKWERPRFSRYAEGPLRPRRPHCQKTKLHRLSEILAFCQSSASVAPFLGLGRAYLGEPDFYKFLAFFPTNTHSPSTFTGPLEK